MGTGPSHSLPPWQENLAEIVGQGNLETSSLAIAARASDHSPYGPGQLAGVAHVENVRQVQAVIKLANEEKFYLTPSSSGVHFNGAALPRKGGIVLDLTRMNRIMELDETHRVARIESGVTWEQFQSYLAARGYRSVMPLLPHASRSVVTDWLEREQPTVHIAEYAEPTMSMQVIWGNGEEFVTGSASINHFRQRGCYTAGTNPMGPGTISFWRFLQGAQGTLGVVTWSIVKVEEAPSLSKPFFIPFENLDDAVHPLYKYLRRRIGYECFLLNNVNLALILAGSKLGEFEQLRQELPRWTILLVLGALRRRPEERIAYEEEALMDIRNQTFPNMRILTELREAPGLEHILPEMLRRPWPKELPYWKHAWRGGCLDLTFMTTMERAPSFLAAVQKVAAAAGYAHQDIGYYLQPVEYGRACQVQFSFFHDPADEEEKSRMRDLHRAAALAVIEEGGVFNRPYGPVAELVYSRNPNYVSALKKVKKLFDPNGVLNPGHLCFD
jgi:hypothetical protein